MQWKFFLSCEFSHSWGGGGEKFHTFFLFWRLPYKNKATTNVYFDFLDVWNGSKYDILDIFKYSWIIRDHFFNDKQIIDVRDFKIETRPSFLYYDSFTLNITNKVKDGIIHSLAMQFLTNDKFDINILLEDSKRKLMNSKSE